MQWASFSAALSHLPAREQERIHRAFDLGKTMHGDQKRKSGEPYFTHPIAVAVILAGMGADADTIIAALLHDTVEDTDLTLDAIDQEFNGSVRNLIDGVTKLFSEDIDDRPTLDEQTETLRKIFTLMQEDIRVMVIKLVDRLHNMETIQFLSEERQRGLAQETQDVFVKIADRLCMQDLRDVLEELTLKILEQETFPALLELRKKSDEQAHEAVQMMNLEFMKPGMPKHLKIHPESKQWSDVQQQLARGKGSVTGLADVILAFECPSIPACYEVLGSLHQKWRREAMSFQDFINSPKINGYQGLHTTIILPDGVRVRCKIRTKEMQVYAHRGVAAYCFDNKAKGLLEYLPWIQHIQSLSDDTKNRSEEFFESLKSDILGESIVVHGTGDHTVLLPAGSTALDGAFYCFHDKALRAKAIQVNGQDVPFFTPLTHSVSLDVQLSARTTVQREWLDWVHTGLATAMIRSQLSNKSTQQKQLMGREILQRRMQERKLGYIEEFDRRKILTRIALLGYQSLEELYEAIAEGHIRTNLIVDSVFDETTYVRSERTERYTIAFTSELTSPGDVDLLRIYQEYLPQINHIRISLSPKTGKRKIVFDFMGTVQICNKFITALRDVGIGNITTREKKMNTQIFIAMLLLTILWGLDPVLAKMLLAHGVEPLTLTSMRLLSMLELGLIATLLVGRTRPLAPIPLRFPSLWTAGLAFGGLALLTYIALASTSPATYNTIIRANAAIIATPFLLSSKYKFRFALMWALTIMGIGILFNQAQETKGILLSLGVLAVFALYTISSSHFQRVALIQARYHQFFFATSLIACLLFLPAILIKGIPHFPSTELTILSVLFTLGLVGIPYLLFYFLLQKTGYEKIAPLFNFSLVVTIVSQWIVFGISNPSSTLSAGALLITGNLAATMLPSHNTHSPQRINKTMHAERAKVHHSHESKKDANVPSA